MFLLYFYFKDVDDTEEILKEKQNRVDRYLKKGWIGGTADKFMAKNNILDFAVEYLIRSSNYNNASVPRLLYESSLNKLNLGDFKRAKLYSEMAEEVYNLMDIFPLSRVDNIRVLTISSNKVNNDTSGYSLLKRFIPITEKQILTHNSDNSDISAGKCLKSLYEALSNYYHDIGNYSESEYWCNQGLDYLYSRKGSKWAPGGNASVITVPNRSFLPFHYIEWKNSMAKGDKQLTDSIFASLKKVFDFIKLLEKNSFDNFEISCYIDHNNYLNWDNRHDESAEENVIESSNNIKNTINRYGPYMHPIMRNKYYELSHKIISDYNGILANSDSINAAETVFNNLLLFNGIQLLNEQLIANAMKFDEKCNELHKKSINIKELNKEELITLFFSDNYDKLLEKHALESQGLKELTSLTFKDIQKELKKDEVVIEFLKAPFWKDNNYKNANQNDDNGFYAAVLKSDGSPVIVPLCIDNDIPSVNQHSGYRNSQLEQFEKSVWTPILPYLNRIKTIYFVPDAELHNLPLEYLPYNKKKSMADKYNMYRLSSSRALTQKKTKREIRDIALFGDMHYNNYNMSDSISRYFSLIEIPVDSVCKEESYFNSAVTSSNNYSSKDSTTLRSIRSTVEDLPNTAIEIKNINSILNKNMYHCDVYSGDAASEENLKSLSGKAPGIIHIATHGKYWNKLDIINDSKLAESNFFKNISGNFDTENALNRSVLLFSGANAALTNDIIPSGDDGILTAMEISLLDFSNVDLLVLSACQTGLGDVLEDGVFGLQRGFKKAGVNSILMSLWEVDDEATQIFMNEFYKHYVKGCSKYESLRKAQNFVRKKNPNSQKWAAFVLLDALN